MKAYNTFSICVLSLVSFAFLPSASAYVAGERLAPSMHVGTYDMAYYGEYFSTDKNLSNDYGDTDALPFDNSYVEFANRVEGGYTFDFPARAFAATRMTYAKADTVILSVNENRTTTEFNSLAAGGQYFIKTKRLLIIPEFFYEHSFEDIEFGQTDPITSDATSAIQAGAYVASYVWKFKSEAFLGYRHHTEDLADMLLWSWRLALRYTDWSVTGTLAGGIPVSDDVDKNFPGNRQILLNATNGGSFRHYYTNPQWIDGGVEGAYKIDPKMRAVIGAKHTLTGKNAAFGLSVLVGFVAEFGDAQASNSKSSDPAFQPELEQYDPTLFK